MMENSDGGLGIDAVSCQEQSCSSSATRSLSSSSFGPNNHPDSSRIPPDQSGLEGIGKGHDESENSELESNLTLAHESRLDSRSTGLEITGSDEMDLEAGEAMECNDETSVALPDIFGNPLILRMILGELPNSKLLELSCVSKLWKKEARVLLKQRGNVKAFLSNGFRFRGCGKGFEAFAANLETLNEPLYSGMTICLLPIDACEGTGALELQLIHESIVAGMRGKLKRLSIRLLYSLVCWNNARNCPSFLLLRHLLRDFIPDLEDLNLEIIATQQIMKPFIQEFLPHGPYPKLKVLKLNDGYGSHEDTFGSQLRMLLSRAPNLQEIRTYGPVSLRENLLEGREGVVHVHESYLYNPVQEISETVFPALRLKWIRFFYSAAPEVQLDRFNEKAQSLLKKCCATTLEELELDAVSAVLFMSYEISLVNVTELKIELEYLELELLEPRILSILSHFDFTHLFPNLNKVNITSIGVRNLGVLSRDIRDAIVEEASAVPIEPTPSRAGNIKKLYLDGGLIPRSAFQFFAHMFPAIQELYVDAEDEIVPVESSWELWPELKLIVVGVERYQRP